MDYLIIGSDLQIASRNYNIIIEDQPMDKGEIVDGYSGVRIGEIHICGKLRPVDQFHTLLHEIEHLIFDTIGLYDSNNTVNAHNEGYIEAKTYLWHQVLKQIIQWQLNTK